MAKMIMAVFIMVAGLVSVAARPAAAQTVADIQKRGYIEIGTSATAPPFSSVDSNNKLVGYDIDWGTLIGKKLGVEVRWQRIEFRGLLPALAAGRLDMVMSAVHITTERQTSFEFSVPYTYEQTVAMVRTDNTAVHKFSDISGRVVVTTAGAFQKDVTVKVGGYKELVLLPNGTDVFLAVSTGHAEVGVSGASALRDYIRSGHNDIRFAGAADAVDTQGIALRKGATDLKAFVDKTIMDGKADGTYATLYRKDFGIDPPPDPVTP